MNSFEPSPGQIIARVLSHGFPSLWDVPITSCKCPEGVG